MSFGKLQRTRMAEPMSEINVTPLVDVMLVLLVIFILTAPLLASSVQLQLPQTGAAKPSNVPVFVTLAIDQRGAVFLQDQPVSLGVLQKSLTQIASDDPLTEVQLRADALVPYGRVVEVMGVAQSAGLSRIGFVAEPVR